MNVPTPALSTGSTTGVTRRLQHYLALALVPLLLVFAASAIQAASADDEYMRLFNRIQDADSLSKSGKTQEALTKYRELYTALSNFKKDNPEWDPEVLSFRFTYLTQRILVLTEELRKPAETTRPAKTAEATAGRGGTQIKLLEPGQEPRAPLRLHPNQGDKQTVTLTTRMAMGVKVGQMESPATKIPAFAVSMDVTAKEVSPEGDIQFETVVTSAEVAAGADALPQVVEAMKASMASFKGVSGKGTFSNRGEAKQVNFDRLTSSTDPASQGMSQVTELFSSLGVIYPEDAVGKGARWEVRRPIKSQGVTIDQTTTFELTSVEGDKLTVNASFTQSAANQKMQIPGQTGAAITLEKMAGRGTATSTVELTKLMPSHSTAKLHSDMETTMSMQGQKQQMTMKMDYDVDLQGK